ncbi:DUF688 family protein [Rhynchospora pubera]|uniref:DUF688 family protein n=1 Tax=Rhynchospora pubera TaxID=906938 RepID=A0AAV8DPR8_9POAL|nr:DUF688 family protein [Rhynchospora pubera]
MASSKLSSYTPSSLRWDPPGSTTPPPQKPGAVPFLWEEKPGKPKKHAALFGPFTDTPTDDKGRLSVQSLELPPRLAAEMKAMQRHVDLNSPSTVLHGPELTKPGTTRVHVTCHSFSYYMEGKKKAKRQKEAWFWRRKKNLHNKQEEEFKFATPTLSRNRSLNGNSASDHSSHFWATIRENLKQVVPWRKYSKNH